VTDLSAVEIDRSLIVGIERKIEDMLPLPAKTKCELVNVVSLSIAVIGVRRDPIGTGQRRILPSGIRTDIDWRFRSVNAGAAYQHPPRLARRGV
jgi:hypothetical protein